MGRMSKDTAHDPDDGPDDVPELPAYAERVLDVAERIPPGRVMTYGDVAEWLGEGGPRQVGRVMALYGGAVPWWRVVRADGGLLPGHELRAMEHYRAEGTPLRTAPRGTKGHIPRLDLRGARWDGTEPVPSPGGDD
ncbi:MGMT family protein [Streptomyces sp. ME01-24h]|nr:MGMT family protein [Streptomyces sp. ME01-24h]